MEDLDWEDIKVFRELALHRTLRSAASTMGVHHSTISRRLEALELALGARLFDRNPDGYLLTDAGETLLSAAGKFSDQLLSAERRIRGQDSELSGDITVTMPGVMAELVFAPRMNEFAQNYPGLTVAFATSQDLLDIARREADIAIRLDNNPPEDLVGKRLATYAQCAYASPSYLSDIDPVSNPNKARWINFSEDRARHPAWTELTGFPDVPAWGYVPDVSLQRDLATSGFGLAYLPCLVGDVASGLVRAGSKPPRPSRDIWLLTHNDLRRTARIRAFMDFAEIVIRDNKSLISGASV